MLLLSLIAGSALAQPTCTPVGMSDIVDVQAPAVLVLGSRRGTQPDLWRARRVVEALEDRGESVTLALDVIHRRHQSTLEQYVRGQLPAEALPQALSWAGDVGFSYDPYEPLVRPTHRPLVAIGLDPEDAPTEGPVQVALEYQDVLRDAMAGAEVPPSRQEDFLQWVAGQDRDLATAALEAWGGQGILVIVADRVRVEGGVGLPAQLELYAEVPVHAALLAWARTPCFPGDRVWRRTPMG